MSDSLEVTLFGRGGHGSSPQATVDPVVMAAASVMRLQTIVSRELAMTDGAVITVGALQAGSSGNIIPSEALLAPQHSHVRRAGARAGAGVDQANHQRRSRGVRCSEAARDHGAGTFSADDQ
jgi:hypothetical protein